MIENWFYKVFGENLGIFVMFFICACIFAVLLIMFGK